MKYIKEVARGKNARRRRAEPGQYIQELQLIVRASLPPELCCAVHVCNTIYAQVYGKVHFDMARFAFAVVQFNAAK